MITIYSYTDSYRCNIIKTQYEYIYILVNASVLSQVIHICMFSSPRD